MAAEEFQLLDFGPGWKVTNENLIELVELFVDQLDWSPRPGEWSARAIYVHLIAARYVAPIVSGDDLAHLPDIGAACRSPEGIQAELARSWSMLARFLSDKARLEALYDDGAGDARERPAGPPAMGSVERASAGFALGYSDEPERYNGHYVAYHRFAHDLHHRSTLIGHLAALGVSLDGHRVRPL